MNVSPFYREKTIGLLDHLGHGNLGDDATLDAVMHNIKSRWSNAKLVGLSLNPYDTEQRHGIQSYAIRRDSKTPPSRDVPESSTASASLKQRLKSLLSRCLPILLVLRTIKKCRSSDTDGIVPRSTIALASLRSCGRRPKWGANNFPCHEVQ
jgi:hypothetical protein